MYTNNPFCTNVIDVFLSWVFAHITYISYHFMSLIFNSVLIVICFYENNLYPYDFVYNIIQ